MMNISSAVALLLTSVVEIGISPCGDCAAEDGCCLKLPDKAEKCEPYAKEGEKCSFGHPNDPHTRNNSCTCEKGFKCSFPTNKNKNENKGKKKKKGKGSGKEIKRDHVICVKLPEAPRNLFEDLGFVG